MVVFWVVMLCAFAGGYQHFGETNHLPDHTTQKTTINFQSLFFHET
jgi:hypothetical protein